MLRNMKVTILITLLHVALVINAQSFYKCQDHQGNVTFSDKACSANAKKHQIKEAYTPDPDSLHTPQQPQSYRTYPQHTESYTEGYSLPGEQKHHQSQNQSAYRCTTVGGRTYYSTTGCRSSNAPIMTPHGPAITLGSPFQDAEQATSRQDACEWAKSRAKKGGLSSDERRSARKMMDEVC